MSALTVDSNTELQRMIDQHGLHFLLSNGSNGISCNQQLLPKSELFKQLQVALKDSSLLCAFDDKVTALNTISAICHHEINLNSIQPNIRSVTVSREGPIYLRGGSYSSAQVLLKNKTWRLVKQCPRYHHVDKDERLIAEIESIAGLPHAAHALFPKIYTASKTEQRVRYEMEYVAYPDFADVIRSGQYPIGRLSQQLHNIYNRLFETLYVPIAGAVNRPTNYVDIIQPRLRELRRTLKANDDLLQLLHAGRLLINGGMYQGLKSTLKLAQNFMNQYPLPATYNHGDLILQDILLNPNSGDFKLVDGNGHSTSYIHDIAKMLLCLETKYDLFYEGSFTLDQSIKDGVVAVNFSFTDTEHLQRLNTMRDNFLTYLEANQTRIFPGIPDWPKVIRVLCGLQNIAIVMFHALHHHKPQRASAFLACGIQLINDTIA